MRRSYLIRSGSTAAFSVLVVACFLLAGCARPVGSVTGKVTYQGKALKGGNVSFISTDGGRSFSAPISEEGNYTVPDLLGGSYKVCVETDSQKPPQQAGGYTAGPGGKMAMPGKSGPPVIPKGAKTGPPPDAHVPEGYTPSDPAAMAAASAGKRYTPIPGEYGNPESTTLTYEFKGGAETFNIDLK